MELRAIWVYPLKSGGGVSVNSWQMDTCGLVDDRRFMLVDEEGRFVSQRTLPQMANLRPEFHDGVIQFSFGKETIEVERVPTWKTTRPVEVWGDRVSMMCEEVQLKCCPRVTKRGSIF